MKKIFIIIFSQLLLLGCQPDLPRPFNKASYHKKENSINTQSQSITTSSELNIEKQKRIELERKLAAIEAKQKQEQERINSDNQEPLINIFTKYNGSNAIISGRVTDNVEVTEVLVDGQIQKLRKDGIFKINFYIPRTGKIVEIVAFDIKGNKSTKILKLERTNIQQASGPTFDALNP